MSTRKVAIAGGSSSVAGDVIEEILARGIFDVTIISRSHPPSNQIANTKWITVNYDDKLGLRKALEGVEVLLSFIVTADAAQLTNVQKNLIDAAIEAGVRRFAPSEWAAREEGAPTYYGAKIMTRKYLEEINIPVKKIEYSLFQPGFFTNYLANQRPTTKHFHMLDMFIDFGRKRALQPDDGSGVLVLTTVEDTARVVALALEYEGEWPALGGMRGSRLSVKEIIALGERLRGHFQVDIISSDDVQAGNVKLPWYPLISSPGVPEEHRESISKVVILEYLKSAAAGGWDVSDEWNKLLPDFKFETAEQYLTRVWE